MRRLIRGTGTLFIITGLLLLYFVVYELVGTSLQTRAHQSALKEAFADILDDPDVVPTVAPSVDPEQSPRPRKTGPAVKPIARILIPKIGVDDYVVEGITLTRLAYGPGHYPDSADIGAKGPTAIAGHRTGWGSPFINLDKIGPGDSIVLVARTGTFTYRITDTAIVDANDGWVINGDPNSKAPAKLTLTTCTPKYTSKRRLIVWADLVKTEPPPASG